MAADRPLRIGLKLAPQWTTIEELRAVWEIAEGEAFDQVWLFDHFAPIFSDPAGPVFEGWTLLAALAERTRRVRIGVMVTGNTYRHPGVLAKMAVTVDHLSGGRLEMGIGAGWAEIEHTMLGLPFPGTGRRIRMLGEACQVMKRLWTEERADFQGRYYTLTGALASPKPLQKPHPPITIGGRGERLTLRIVAEHADAWNFGGGPVEDAARLASVLDAHCAAVGRDPAQIRRSVQMFWSGGDPGPVLEEVARLRQLGFTEFVFTVRGEDAVPNARSAARRLLPELRH